MWVCQSNRETRENGKKGDTGRTWREMTKRFQGVILNIMSSRESFIFTLSDKGYNRVITIHTRCVESRIDVREIHIS